MIESPDLLSLLYIRPFLLFRFQYLFGDEDGTPMLPTEIESQTFQIILSFLAADQIQLVEELYKRDRNLRPEAYVLDFKTSCLAERVSWALAVGTRFEFEVIIKSHVYLVLTLLGL